MMPNRSSLDFHATRVALSPLNLRETCVYLMESAPQLAARLQEEIHHQRAKQGELAEEYLGLHLNIETIGAVIVELTKVGQRALIEADNGSQDRIVIKELIECWLELAEWILTDLEITDGLVH